MTITDISALAKGPNHKNSDLINIYSLHINTMASRFEYVNDLKYIYIDVLEGIWIHFYIY